MKLLILNYKFSVKILLYTFVIAIVVATAASKYTEDERIAIEKFRPIVLDALTKDFQKMDSYLIRWLRAKELNLGSAAEMLRKAQKWRKENKVDTILEEPNIFDEPAYSGIIESVDGFDKQGTPLLQYSFGKLNIRGFILEGKEKYFRRSLILMWEKFELIAQQSANRTGSDESQVVIISDFAGFNKKQHMCVPCVPFVLGWTQIMENYYPGLFKLHFFINVPRGYDFLAERSQEIYSDHTKKITKIFGLNKSEWSPFLDKYIAPEQRSYQFGGTKVKKA